MLPFSIPRMSGRRRQSVGGRVFSMPDSNSLRLTVKLVKLYICRRNQKHCCSGCMKIMHLSWPDPGIPQTRDNQLRVTCSMEGHPCPTQMAKVFILIYPVQSDCSLAHLKQGYPLLWTALQPSQAWLLGSSYWSSLLFTAIIYEHVAQGPEGMLNFLWSPLHHSKN